MICSSFAINPFYHSQIFVQTFHWSFYPSPCHSDIAPPPAAARTRLRKLRAEEAAKNGASAASSTAPVEKSPHAKGSYDIAEFETLAPKYEKLNWRIISKPGGATVKPDEFYSLYGFYMQATNGDNTAERPMWAEKGGLDFEGRARWDAWTAVKGVSADKAKLEFVKTYYEFPVKCLYTDTRGK